MSQPYDEPLPLDVTRVCATPGCNESLADEVRRYCRPHQAEVDHQTLAELIAAMDPSLGEAP